MDLVSRLRRYIDHIAMPVTQFADTCGIPRPTMSQLLSGRNKKVSNELIAKIHDAFPVLNILWLMFGQGDMLVSENIPLSKAQNHINNDESESQIPDDKKIGELIVNMDEFSNEAADNSEGEKAASADSGMPSATTNDNETCESTSDKSAGDAVNMSPSVSRFESLNRAISNGSTAKRIVNIIVYYSDNSFEAFIPEKS